MKTITIFIILGFIALAVILPAAAVGGGPGYGYNQGFNVTIPEPLDYAITDTEMADLYFMREEEQMAHDLYQEWSEKYALPIFANIAQAEETHASEVQFLLDRYNLSSQRIGNMSTGYENPILLELSVTLAEQGSTSLNDALKAGVIIEEQDISDLDKAIANTTREDLKVVYGNLRSGSENHLSAFNNQLS